MENQDIGKDSQSSKTKSTNSMDLEQLKMKYVESLSEKLRQAYLIAKEHLGTSFTLEKSIGYLKWLETYEETYEESEWEIDMDNYIEVDEELFQHPERLNDIRFPKDPDFTQEEKIEEKR